VWAQLFGLACETVPLDDEMRVGSRIIGARRADRDPNPNAPTGVALAAARKSPDCFEDHPDIPVVIDEAYVEFGGESAVPLIAIIRTCWSCRRCRSRALWPGCAWATRSAAWG